MEYLQNACRALPLIPVFYDHSITACLDRDHGRSYRDFVTFPVSHGYQINEDYIIDDNPNNISGSEESELCGALTTKEVFLQAWLFFGVLRCVLRENATQDLISSLYRIKGKALDTSKLPGALEAWSEGLIRQGAGAKERCIEAVRILTFARRVIIANLADDNICQSTQNVPTTFQRTAPQELCLMILGETLSAALARIMKICRIDIRGWRLDGDGWGPPSYVLRMMRDDSWCPRFQATLRGQLGRSATLLYVTYQLHQFGIGTDHHNVARHSGFGCTKDKCEYIEACDGTVNDPYRPQHHVTCPGQKNRDLCWMIGPNENEIQYIIRNAAERDGSFPLLRYVGEGTDPHIEVLNWSKDKSFTTISHVWAHGLGNEREAKVWKCQLDHIQQLLGNSSSGEKPPKPPLFWLDTLTIPIRIDNDNDREELRRKAIDSICHIFREAERTIIIDRQLLGHETIGQQATISIRLLSSGWMKRLWTLQEAFVTRRLYQAGQGSTVLDMNDLWGLEDESPSIESLFAAMVEQKLSRNLMLAQPRISDEKTRSESESGNATLADPDLERQQKEDWASLIGNAWTSSTYRSVGRLQNETLAIASLLDLPVPQVQLQLQESSDNQKRDRLMRAFWESMMNMKSPWAIPTGMIFTPGERISLQGFGWAPRTWLSGKEESYPYPLGAPSYSDQLGPKGLEVKYPGFLIHAAGKKYEDLLVVGDAFWNVKFPTSASLTDWYRVEPFEGEISTATNLYVQELLARDPKMGIPRFGIILSRPRPGAFPPEVGLLVEIKTENDRKRDRYGGGPKWGGHDGGTNAPPAEILYCNIIRRLQISRVSNPGDHIDRTRSTDVLEKYQLFDAAMVGEALDDDQHWCVDGFIEHVEDTEFTIPQDSHGSMAASDIQNNATTSDGLLRRLLSLNYSPSWFS